MRLEELFSSSGPHGLAGLSQALARTGFFHSREGYYLKRPSQSDLPVNLSVSRIHTEPEPVGLVVARDISERKRAEEALKQAETRYNSLIASTGVMVWEIDATGHLVAISPAFQTILGWSRGDWIGKRFDELLDPLDRAPAMRTHQRAWLGETVPRYELRIRTATGECALRRVPDGYQDSRGYVGARPGHHPRYHRAEAQGASARAGRFDAAGQGGSRTRESGQE